MRIEEMEEQVELAKKRKKKRKIIIITVVSILVIIGAVGTSFLLLPKKEVKVEEERKEQQEEVEIKNLEIVDLKSKKRPIAVMIDNNTGRNNNNSHAGLQESFLNYEIIVEGGLTRIMALFKDKDVSLIGPVRSSRHYFLDYALESEAIYAHFGWSTYAENDIKSLKVNNINGLYLSAPYWRDKTIAAPHNVFTTTEKLYEAAEKEGYELEHEDWKLLDYSYDEVNFEAESTEETNPAQVANTVTLRYSNAQTRSYQYDNERKVYLRFMNGAPHNDKTTKEQLNYKNIIIMIVRNETLDSYGRQDLDTVGSGDGYYITNGYSRAIKWQKKSRRDKTTYTYLDGTKVNVNDGNTFIQVLPPTYGPEIS